MRLPVRRLAMGWLRMRWLRMRWLAMRWLTMRWLAMRWLRHAILGRSWTCRDTGSPHRLQLNRSLLWCRRALSG